MIPTKQHIAAVMDGVCCSNTSGFPEHALMIIETLVGRLLEAKEMIRTARRIIKKADDVSDLEIAQWLNAAGFWVELLYEVQTKPEPPVPGLCVECKHARPKTSYRRCLGHCSQHRKWSAKGAQIWWMDLRCWFDPPRWERRDGPPLSSKTNSEETQ